MTSSDMRPARQQTPPDWPLPPQAGALCPRPALTPQQVGTGQDAPAAVPAPTPLTVQKRPPTPEVILGRLRARYNPHGFLILWDGRGTWSALRGLTLIQRLTPLDLRIAIDAELAAAAPAPALTTGPTSAAPRRSARSARRQTHAPDSPERNGHC